MANQHAAKDDPLRGKKSGKWSKYGQPKYGLVKEAIDGEWCCQACGKTIPATLKPFLYEIFEDEYIRVCNVCMYMSAKISKEQSFLIIRRVIRIMRES